MNSHEVFIHIHQGCFAGTGAIVRLPQLQWSKPDGYGKISQCITTTKHSKAKTVCIFLGIYCIMTGYGRLVWWVPQRDVSYISYLENILIYLRMEWLNSLAAYRTELKHWLLYIMSSNFQPNLRTHWWLPSIPIHIRIYCYPSVWKQGIKEILLFWLPSLILINISRQNNRVLYAHTRDTGARYWAGINSKTWSPFY